MIVIRKVWRTDEVRLEAIVYSDFSGSLRESSQCHLACFTMLNAEKFVSLLSPLELMPSEDPQQQILLTY